jgi:hypothetical protein
MRREAIGLFERLDGAGEASGAGGAKDELFNQLKGALKLHTKLEEQIFYPALENFDETRDLIKESYGEHRKVDQLLAEISPSAGDFADKLSELRGTSRLTWKRKRARCSRRQSGCSIKLGFRRWASRWSR